MALPRSLDRRAFTPKSKTMSATTRSIRARELSTFCIVPHWLFSSSFCQSFRPRVLASNHWSILSCEPNRWSMSRASYTRSSTTWSSTASLNL